jgi:hypothetical protein
LPSLSKSAAMTVRTDEGKAKPGVAAPAQGPSGRGSMSRSAPTQFPHTSTT